MSVEMDYDDTKEALDIPHLKDVISTNYGPISYHESGECTSYYDRTTDRFYASNPAIAGNSFIKAIGGFMTRLYGTYECTIKVAGAVNHNWLYPAFWEWWFNGAIQEGILPECLDGSYQFTTWNNNVSETNALAGQDWTVERTLKIVWDASNVYCYIDGVEKAHNTVRIPDHILHPMSEARTRNTGTPAANGEIWCGPEHFNGRDYTP